MVYTKTESKTLEKITMNLDQITAAQVLITFLVFVASLQAAAIYYLVMKQTRGEQ